MTGDMEEMRKLQQARDGSGSGKYVRELPPDPSSSSDDDSDSDAAATGRNGSRRNPLDAYSAPQHLLHEYADEDEDPLRARAESRQIAARQNEYQLRRFNRDLNQGAAVDPFAQNNADNAEEHESYKDRMRRAELEREEQRVHRLIKAKQSEDAGQSSRHPPPDEWDVKREPATQTSDGDRTPKARRKRRWDVAASDEQGDAVAATDASHTQPQPSEAAPRKRRSRWDEAPADGDGPNDRAQATLLQTEAKRSRLSGLFRNQ